MRKYRHLTVIFLAFVLFSGCTEPMAPSHGDPQTTGTSSISTANVRSPPARERTIVTLTDAAIAKFKELLAAEPTKHIRLSVKREGPTGFVYDLQIEDSINDSDFVDRSHGFTLVVDPESSIYLEGAAIDWQTQPDGQAGFKFDNPNALDQ